LQRFTNVIYFRSILVYRALGQLGLRANFTCGISECWKVGGLDNRVWVLPGFRAIYTSGALVLSHSLFLVVLSGPITDFMIEDVDTVSGSKSKLTIPGATGKWQWDRLKDFISR